MTPPVSAPPALHFLVTLFAYACGVHLCTFTCTTDTPVRLTAHVSAERPAIRRIPYVKRGADFVLSSLTCFIETQTIVQSEPGDTLTHTFAIPFPEYNNTYYWYLTGTQGGVPCQSISQVFWHACAAPTYPPVTIKIYSDPQYFGTTVDGAVYRQYANATWANIHDGAGSYTQESTTSAYVMINSWSTRDRWIQLYRFKCTFNLAAIPIGSTILSAKYYVNIINKYNNLLAAPAWGIYSSQSPPYNRIYTYMYLTFGTTPLSDITPYAAIPATGWHYWTLNAAGLALLIPGGLVSLGIREANYDVANIMPPWRMGQFLAINFWTVDYPGTAADPYLEVTYQQH